MLEDKKRMMLVVTNQGCFISDCYATSGYDYNYHQPIIKALYFDREKAEGTYYANWYKLSKRPVVVEKLITGKRTNERYIIKNSDNITKKFPEVILYEDRGDYDYDVLESLYSYTYDNLPDEYEKVDTEFETVCDVEMAAQPDINYNAIHKSGWSDEPYKITNANVQHQMLDKIIFPAVLLHERPCEFTSKQMYDITRQHVKDHIDNSKATITSDYDFCFGVSKLVPLLEPKTASYSNIFARTKRERNKITYKTHTTKETQIFQMTHNQENYKGYTAIDPIFANNETELKEKVDTWLTGLMDVINAPLYQCPHCSGTGYTEETKPVNKNEVIAGLNGGK